MGLRVFLLEPIPAVSRRGQGTPWTSCQLMAGPSLMVEAAMQGANRTSGANWGSVSRSRTLADLLYPLSYSRPTVTRWEGKNHISGRYSSWNSIFCPYFFLKRLHVLYKETTIETSEECTNCSFLSVFVPLTWWRWIMFLFVYCFNVLSLKSYE